MKKIFIPCALILLAVTAVTAGELTAYIPKTGKTVYQLRHLSANPAWQPVLDICRQKLGESQDPQLRVLSYIFKQFDFTEISGALIAPENGNNVLIIAPDLSGKAAQLNRFLIENLGTLVAVDQEWQKRNEAGANIYFDRRGEENEKLTSFCVQDHKVLLASNSSLVNQLLRTGGKPDNITADPLYRELAASALKDYDGLVYIDNGKHDFSRELKKWEDNNKMVVLLSSDWIAGVFVSFKLTAADQVKGRIVFKTNDRAKLPLVRNDAQFLGEAAKRRYGASQLDIKSKVTENGSRVTLDFEASNWRPILEQEWH
jgi:hypothetical protein